MAKSDGLCAAAARALRSIPAAFCSAVMLLGGASIARAEERSFEDMFALDEIAESGPAIMLYQDLILLSLDDRVEYNAKEETPYLGMSILYFYLDGGFVQFCLLWQCQDPLHFKYSVLEESICLTETRSEIAGCYTLETRDGQLDWIDEAGTRVATSFTAIYPERTGRWEQFFVPLYHETGLRSEGGRGGEIIDGLTALGLLEPDAGEQFDARVRGGIVELQRRNGIFPSGFVGESTLRVIEGIDPLGPELEEPTAAERGPGPLTCFDAPSSACLLDLAREMVDAVEKDWLRNFAASAVAEALALAGRLEEALEVANALEVEGDKDLAIYSMASGLARAGKFEEALAVARTIDSASPRSSALTDVATALASAGRTEEAGAILEEALAAAADTEGAVGKARALARIAAAQADAGLAERAKATLEEAVAAATGIEDVEDKVSALVDIVAAQTDAGLAERARATVEEALAAAGRIEDVEDKASALADIAEAQVEAGMVEEAGIVLGGALEVAATIDSDFRRGSALGDIAEVFALAGMADRATEVASGIDDEFYRNRALRFLPWRLARAGKTPEALEVANGIEDAGDKAHALAGVARIQIEGGLVEQASAVLADAVAIAERIEGAEERASALTAIAESQAEGGMAEEARAVLKDALRAAARLLRDPDEAILPLLSIAQVWIQIES